ncbi:hypothetical protein ILUMI_11153 [Ignelater luminosus]|uniref:Uncharacterized protein n=1 Tax=Ignelater luminosus TaxID=2038154 RepID=A0A8K0GDH7_IGNLU|nr:hypothetical protein ILUMI_11153 [Ignelater luminosus]
MHAGLAVKDKRRGDKRSLKFSNKLQKVKKLISNIKGRKSHYGCTNLEKLLVGLSGGQWWDDPELQQINQYFQTQQRKTKILLMKMDSDKDSDNELGECEEREDVNII